MEKSRIPLVIGFWLCLAVLAGSSVPAGERSFSLTNAPTQGENIPFDFNIYALGKYLTECQVNRPEILNEVKRELAAGGYYRKRVKDQKGTSTILTVYVDRDYMLRAVTYRNDTCPTCNGSGKRKAPIDKLSKHIAVNFRCLDCKGDGLLENNTTEKYYILSAEDFADPQRGRQIMQQKAYAGAPSGAAEWVARLASSNPRERLAACDWLDQNYVRTGMFFQDIMPMLKKARYYDANEKKRIMVWQFWAGKDLAEERRRAYYRVYADAKSGKITEKGFYAGK